MQILIAYKLQCPLSDPIRENSNLSPVYPKGNGFCWPGIKTSPRRPWLIPGELPGTRNSNMMADSPIDPLNSLFELPEFSNIQVNKDEKYKKLRNSIYGRIIDKYSLNCLYYSMFKLCKKV